MLIARPGRMGPLRLRNRIIMGPMGTNFSTTDGLSTERDGWMLALGIDARLPRARIGKRR